ncbi:GTP 3',8-cyclase MoaA [Alicyclobacillaceae bacterium I2511]|nr:GTP 3',8-cyclase MoaA [Alicyclobacillaceae bacterium I2511]
MKEPEQVQSLPCVKDARGRLLRDLRISVTDRCNFRCRYCMPREVFDENYTFLPHSSLLTFEEITRISRAFAAFGGHKLRLTGGEPLLRRDLEILIDMLVRIPGIDDIAMTTNGSLLTVERARSLRDAGLTRVSVSLDALDDDIFMAMNDVQVPVTRVLSAIEAAQTVGLSPVKVNMVVRRGFNEGQILPMAAHFRGTEQVLRLIEYMDVGNSNGWRMDDVISAEQMLALIGQHWPLRPLSAQISGEVARRYAYVDGMGEIGIIASVTQPFCSGCSRIRLTSDGQLFTCLFGDQDWDMRERVRRGDADEELVNFLTQIWGKRSDHYSEVRLAITPQRNKIEMSRIGG